MIRFWKIYKMILIRNLKFFCGRTSNNPILLNIANCNLIMVFKKRKDVHVSMTNSIISTCVCCHLNRSTRLILETAYNNMSQPQWASLTNQQLPRKLGSLCLSQWRDKIRLKIRLLSINCAQQEVGSFHGDYGKKGT